MVVIVIIVICHQCRLSPLSEVRIPRRTAARAHFVVINKGAGKFVTAKCSCINYGATLRGKVLSFTQNQLNDNAPLKCCCRCINFGQLCLNT